MRGRGLLSAGAKLQESPVSKMTVVGLLEEIMKTRGIEWTDLFLSPDDHWAILRDFIIGFGLRRLAIGLMVNGMTREDVNRIVNDIGLSTNDPLNNPFRNSKVKPLPHYLRKGDVKIFGQMLKKNKETFLTVLTEPPNEWTVKQATDEWHWLVKHLEEL